MDNHFDAKAGEFSERRVNANSTESKLVEIVGMIKTVDQKVDFINQNVEQRLIDNRAITEIQYQHIDSLMETHRQDNLNAHAALIEAFKDHTQAIVAKYDDRMESTEKRIGCMEKEIVELDTRITDIEQAPARAALTSRQKVIVTIKNAVLVAGITSIIGLIAVISRWQAILDFIKGKP